MPFLKTCEMSVNEEKSPTAELSEKIESLQRELSSLSVQLKSQADEAEKERLELLVGDILAEIEVLKVTTVEPTSTTFQTDNPRKSSRERKLTRDLSKGE